MGEEEDVAKFVQGRKYCICRVSASEMSRGNLRLQGQGNRGWRRKPGGLGSVSALSPCPIPFCRIPKIPSGKSCLGSPVRIQRH